MSPDFPCMLGQRDVMGLTLFYLSLRHDDSLNLLYQAWFLDDGVLAGTKSSLHRAAHIIGIFINLSKCGSDTTMFPDHESLSLFQSGYPWCFYW